MRITSFDDYKKFYELSVAEPELFWEQIANEFYWQKKWEKVLEWNFHQPEVKWFLNAKTNITYNCLDINVQKSPNKIAFVWEQNEDSNEHIEISYSQLLSMVCQMANVLKANGIKKGDTVCIYLPMIPQAIVSMLACARIGAIHNVVFGGFSANSLTGRIQDSNCKMVITSDGAFRGNKTIPMKDTVDIALKECPGVQKVLICKRTNSKIDIVQGRDLWLDDEIKKVSDVCEPEWIDSEDMLFILYTSGSTGKPKGVVHTTGGYMVFMKYSFENVFQYESNQLFWCTADVGWVTGHSYIVYGPLLAGASSLIFEGIPTYPDAGRFWKIIDKHQVNILYTAPTAIRALQAFGDEFVNPYSLNSLKVLGSVGEPINEEAWQWYFEKIGKKKCPIVDTWWQTETGGILISPLANITPLKPSYATLPLPGVQPVLVDENGNCIEGNGVEGNLCIKFPWPSIIRTTYGDHERCRLNYFSTYSNFYFTGDGCKRDENGYYRITGRVDDVINVSGHRIGTAEVENAINQHVDIVESAVVGYPHEIKGQGIYAYVICTNDKKDHNILRNEIVGEVNKLIGPIAKPDKIQIVSGLPKTRSGKIMRRILRKVAEGDFNNLGDISTLLDPVVVDEIKKGAQNLLL